MRMYRRAHIVLCGVAVAGLALLGCNQNVQKSEKTGAPKASQEDALRRAMSANTSGEKGELPAGHPPVSSAPGEMAGGMGGGSAAGGSTTSAAGVTWTVPEGWQAQGPRPMRAATFSIPAASGDAEGAECGVFFFGSGQGGDPEANIARWAAQFEGGPTPERATREVNGIAVKLVKISGTYLAPAGPMMQ